jgi:hypothetical protein
MTFDEISNAIDDIADYFLVKDKVPLFHYTKIESLKSIIENKEFWASNSIF